MARNIFMIIILFGVAVALFCEELEYITIRRTMLYANPATNPRSNNEPVFEIDKGITVKYSQRPYLYVQTTKNGVNSILGTFIYSNTRYYIDCADLVPANTVDTFNPSFISDLNSNDRKIWVPSYYTKVLQSLDRDTVLLLDPYWEHDYDPWWQQAYDVGEQAWHEYFDAFFPINEFYISNSALVLNRYIRFLITNIRRTTASYMVTVKFTDEDWRYRKKDSLNWDKVNGKEFFDMLLCVDGEYMDVYLDDMEHKLTTFVLADQIFLNEMKTLIRNNHADLSRITSWPRRADGSMDYPPPLDMSGYTATHHTLDNLRLRDSASTTAKLVTTLPKGTEVQAVETGPAATIDGISAHWVKVISGSGYTGWCFGGYLEEIKKPDVANSVEVASAGIDEIQADEAAQSNAEQRSLPLWALLAIIGGVAVVAGAVVFLTVKRKKRR